MEFNIAVHLVDYILSGFFFGLNADVKDRISRMVGFFIGTDEIFPTYYELLVARLEKDTEKDCTQNGIESIVDELPTR